MTSLAAPGVSHPRRVAIVSVAVMAALVLVWLAATWQWHDTWRAGRSLDAAFYLPPVAFIAVALVHYLWCFARRRPVAFEVRDGAFIAPPADQLSAATAMTLFAVGAGTAEQFLWPLSTDASHLLLGFGRASPALVLVACLLWIAVFARHTGRVVLRPDGLRITYAYGTRDIPWDAVAAGPPRSGSLIEPTMRIAQPDLVRSTGLARRRPRKALLPTTTTWIRREFLLDAINYYLATPAARPTIGTTEGYSHLRRVLRAD